VAIKLVHSKVGGGVACINPGKRKLAGETLWLALMPPQPAPPVALATSIANHRIFHFNLTCGV